MIYSTKLIKEKSSRKKAAIKFYDLLEDLDTQSKMSLTLLKTF